MRMRAIVADGAGPAWGDADRWRQAHGDVVTTGPLFYTVQDPVDRRHMESSKRCVTVVLPIYADWESLGRCIESLKEHLDARHAVLLVNDCGPEADAIERRVLEAIADRPNFGYHRNTRNLGYVKTCNRAVLELDQTDNDVLLLNSDTIVTEGFLEEMLEVLYLSDRHGVVTPRSNNATLATVPLRPVDAISREDLAYSRKVYDAIRDRLPRYAVVPVGVGFCLLVRRRLIRNFGFLDEAFGRGYNEENDFCLRINKYGYSSILSNHAFVYHLGSRSFSESQHAELEQHNRAVLVGRHPYYPGMVRRYFDEDIDPVDHFADVIAGVNPKRKVLINLFHFPSVMAGAVKTGLSMLRHLQYADLKRDNVELAVLCQEDAAQYHRLDRFGFRLIHPHTIGDEVFHISFCPMQFFHPENLLITNRHALRTVFALLDIIVVRCQYLLAEDARQRAVFRDALRLADHVITISEFTRADTLAYFVTNTAELADKLKTIYPGVPRPSSDGTCPDRDRRTIRRPTLTDTERFVLVFGNQFAHKAIDAVLPVLERERIASVILGPPSLRRRSEHVVVVPSGWVPEEELEALLAHCGLVLFPSQYEGFGFPMLEAAYHGKPVLYYASPVGEEIAQLARAHTHVEAFETFDQLPAKIRAILSRQSLVPAAGGQPLRSLDDYNREVWALLLELAARPYNDFRGLRARWEYFTSATKYAYSQPGLGAPRRTIEHVVAKLKEYPYVYRAARQVYWRIWLRAIPPD